jgi:SAM-dependent methyltransferase
MTHSSLTETANEFDQWATNGRAESMANGHGNVSLQMLALLPQKIKGKSLDIGCGNGWMVRESLFRGIEQGYGLDISPKMVQVAADSKDFAEREHYFVSHAEKIDVPDQEFDLITSIESLYYYPNPVEALQEWYRICKADGQLAIMIDLYEENPATHTWIDALDISVHLLSKAQIKEELEKIGWKNVQLHQIQDTRPMKSEEDFQKSTFWPSYAQYRSYRNTGSLCIIAEK